MNIAATKSLRPNKAQLNAGPKLKVQQLVIPEVKRLQKQELQAQRKLRINKPINQIPKPKTKPKVTTNHLQAPYKKPIAKTAAKPTVKTTAKPQSRTLTFGDTTIELPRDLHKLEQMKEEALEYWRTLPEIT